MPDVDTRQKQAMCKMLYVMDSKLGEVAESPASELTSIRLMIDHPDSKDC